MLDMDKIKTNLKDFLLCISKTQDLISPVLTNHHQQVAYLSYRLAEKIGFAHEHIKDITLAALVHDIGALSIEERIELIETDPLYTHTHAFRGAKLLSGFAPLKNSIQIIKYHHMNWENGKNTDYRGENVPYMSHVIHLADRVCASISPNRNILSQIPYIYEKIRSRSGTQFEPNIVDAFGELCGLEYVWLDLISRSPVDNINDLGLFDMLDLNIDEVLNLSTLFSQLIDFRSSFTARHSAGVAKTAECIAGLVGFSRYECKMMKIAGYLHDLGKVAISNDILEKPGKLKDLELNEIRAHTYYTYRLLEPIKQLQTINIWASFHHEKLDGTGYPFHIKGENLPLGSRIMAVADVFTAITENRPYRKGMNTAEVKSILGDMVSSGAIDARIVKALTDNYESVNMLRKQAQLEAADDYRQFLSIK